ARLIVKAQVRNLRHRLSYILRLTLYINNYMARTPYNWTPELHQLPIISNSARFKVIVWHRKAHKTTLALNELIRWANAIEGTYWYVAPFYGEAKETVWQDSQMLPKYCPP